MKTTGGNIKLVNTPINSMDALMTAINLGFGEPSVKKALTKLTKAEEVIKQLHGTKRLWESTRIKILLAILAHTILPGRMATYDAILQQTQFQKSDIFSIRKALILEGLLHNQFTERKREIFRQALAIITKTELDPKLKRQAAKIITILSNKHYTPTIKGPNILAGIALKASAEVLKYDITTQRICQDVGSSYLPQQKVREVLNLVKSI